MFINSSFRTNSSLIAASAAICCDETKRIKKEKRQTMNRLYLMKYVSCLLHTIVRHYDHSHVQTDYFCGRPDFEDSYLADEVLLYCRQIPSDLPLIFDVNSLLCYSRVSHSEGFYLVGPLRFSSPVPLLKQMNVIGLGESRISEVPVCSFQDLLSAVLLLYNLHHQDELEQDALITHCCIPKGADDKPLKAFSDLIFQNQECGRKHNPYGQELREQRSIELGDTELLRKSLEEDYIGELGTLSRDNVRNWKYLGSVVTTLASRSAIRGGLTPEVAFSMQDSYMQEIDESNSVPHIIHLMRAAEFQFARMVREQKERQAGIAARENPYIEQCKDYIFSHLHDKLEVSDIAEQLSLNANYLSELFHKYEGVTLKAYIHQEKIQLVKNLLTYSQYTYSEIAAYLGYSSQSHLGKIFRKITGYTMSSYRKEFGLPEFL